MKAFLSTGIAVAGFFAATSAAHADMPSQRNPGASVAAARVAAVQIREFAMPADADGAPAALPAHAPIAQYTAGNGVAASTQNSGEPAAPDESEDDGPFVSDDDQPFLADEDSSDSASDDSPFFADGNGERNQQSSSDGEDDSHLKRISFQHRYRVQGGSNRTDGIFIFFTGKDRLNELRLLNSYQQTIRIEDSPTDYKYVRFSIEFSQNYDVESEQFFDNYFVFNEIYFNARWDANQLRWGNQIFRLGTVDIDSPLDVLHFRNAIGLLTFDQDASRESIPSVRYDRFMSNGKFTVYFSPIARQTFGMRATRFRDESDARDAGKSPQKNSLLRDYAGVQQQWLGDVTDIRVGLFHWFDSNPFISWTFRKQSSDAAVSSFNDLANSFREEERQVNFATLEASMTFDRIGWKADFGIFDKKNFYDYRQSENGDIFFDTVRARHGALAMSFEMTFPYFFSLFSYSNRLIMDVPGGTHILLYENEETPRLGRRNLSKQNVTGVFKFLFNDEQSATLMLARTVPFEQTTAFVIWSWARPVHNEEWSLKWLRLSTERLKITGVPINSTQVFLAYTRKFSTN